MAVRPEVVLFVLLAALVVAVAQGGSLETMRLVFDGDHGVEAADDALVVAGGSVEVPAGERADGSLYVVGGDARVDGTLTGDVVQLSGSLALGEDAAIEGDLQAVGGTQTVADGAVVRGDRQVGGVPVDAATDAGPVQFALQTGLLALAGFVLGRRAPAQLRNVGRAVTDHPLVSGTVGTLAAVVGATLFVVMAFTIVLIPVSVAGVLVGLLVVGYATVVYGFLLGRPVGRRVGVEDAGLATAAGVVGFAVLLELLGRVPVVGALVPLGLVVTGVGAVLVSYFGYSRFEPATLD